LRNLDSEIITNKEEIIDKIGQPVKYGEKFILMHTFSGMFLKAARDTTRVDKKSGVRRISTRNGSLETSDFRLYGFLSNNLSDSVCLKF
jgi:hypothetical protein